MKRQFRDDFPLLKEHSSLAYCDNAATAQKPQYVIDCVDQFCRKENAPVHRGIYTLAETATVLYERARENVRAFLNAEDISEIVFTHGATESLNTIAAGWARYNLKAGDEVVVTEMEHHANLVPWQRLEKEIGVVLKFIPITEEGDLDYAAVDTVITPRTKVVSVTGGSNVIGIDIHLDRIAKRAHEVGAVFIVDAAQSAPRSRIDVRAIGCDCLVIAPHKLMAPTGVGAFYVNKKLHETFEPLMVGGSMVLSVDWHDSIWRPVPQRLEAGTPAIAQVVGLGAAIEYINQNVDFDWVAEFEAELCRRVVDGLLPLNQVRILGPIEKLRSEGHLVSFSVEGMHSHDVAAFLDSRGIAVRAGHHCAQPLHNKLGVPNSVRASFYIYNSIEDAERLVKAMQELLGV
ncbi:MAG: SufS family cysteine desulfurase [Candidatus Babeliaceae bacterium]|nr:SufS family cysteine desulfurase [Candidatus Babeliaceae bacterium]